jgi:hypothetical protein
VRQKGCWLVKPVQGLELVFGVCAGISGLLAIIVLLLQPQPLPFTGFILLPALCLAAVLVTAGALWHNQTATLCGLICVWVGSAFLLLTAMLFLFSPYTLGGLLIFVAAMLALYTSVFGSVWVQLRPGGTLRPVQP